MFFCLLVCFILLFLLLAAVSAEQIAILRGRIKPAKCYNFCAVLLILHMMASSAQNSLHAESHSSDSPRLIVLIWYFMFATACTQLKAHRSVRVKNCLHAKPDLNTC